MVMCLPILLRVFGIGMISLTQAKLLFDIHEPLLPCRADNALFTSYLKEAYFDYLESMTLPLCPEFIQK